MDSNTVCRDRLDKYFKYLSSGLSLLLFSTSLVFKGLISNTYDIV